MRTRLFEQGTADVRPQPARDRSARATTALVGTPEALIASSSVVTKSASTPMCSKIERITAWRSLTMSSYSVHQQLVASEELEVPHQLLVVHARIDVVTCTMIAARVGDVPGRRAPRRAIRTARCRRGGAAGNRSTTGRRDCAGWPRAWCRDGPDGSAAPLPDCAGTPARCRRASASGEASAKYRS